MTGPRATAIGSSAVQDYLKAIYSLSERGGDPATTSRLAERLSVGASSVSGMIRRLTELGLVEHRPYGAIELTDAGRQEALAVLRRHRLLEMYLVAELGYGWDEVHDEAEALEHAVSEQLMARMDTKLGHPQFDPHGDPIPSRDGRLPKLSARRLTTLAEGESGTLVRVDDFDPAMLRHLAAAGIGLGQHVLLQGRKPFDGPLVVGVDGVEHDLAPGLAAALWIASESESGNPSGAAGSPNT